jgi:flagellar hook-associated protein 2
MSSVSSTTSATVKTATTSSSVARSGLTEDEAVTLKVQPMLDKIDSINSKITTNKAKVTAYQSMQTKLQTLQTAVDALRSPVSSSSDVFKVRSATLSSSSSTAASDLMSATVATGTTTGTHSVTITQLATAERVSSATQTSKSSALNTSGVFTIGETGKTASSITVTDSMSLSDIVSAVNNQSSTTGVTASIVTVSSSTDNPQYKMLLTATDTGLPINMTTTSGTALSDLGVTGSDGTTAASVLQEAKSAILTVDGVTGITRTSNDIDDILDGVTLHLTQADASNPITMKIGNDTSSIETAISTFASAYNDWRTFVNDNQATDSTGVASSSATLFGDSNLRAASLQIDTAVNSLVNGTSLSAIGITLNSSNQLEIDSTALESALTDNFSAVQKLFEYQATTSNGDLKLTSHGSSTYTGDFTMDITTDDSGAITHVSAKDAAGKAIDLNYNGKTISGVAGTAYEGLTFYYSGATTASISVSASQGIADQMYQASDAVADKNTGSLQTVITNIQDQDTTLTTRASEIQTSANNYATFLLDQYGKLEASISAAEQTQSLLTTMMGYDTSSG